MEGFLHLSILHDRVSVDRGEHQMTRLA